MTGSKYAKAALPCVLQVLIDCCTFEFCGFVNYWHLITNDAGFDSIYPTTKPSIMNCELITESEILDILFEKRNKAYGAYTLRKFYNNRLMKSIGKMMGTVIVFSAFTFLPATDNTVRFIVEEQVFGSITPAAKLPKLKPAAVKQVKPSRLSVQKFLSSMLIVNSKDSSDRLHDLKDVSVGDITNIIPGNSTDALLVGSATGFAGNEAPLKIAEPIPDITQPVDNPEIMPEFPGGMAALRSFLERYLRNPGNLEEGELINVKVKFVVTMEN